MTHIKLRLALSEEQALFIIQSCPKLTDFEATLNRDDRGSLSREVVVNKSLQKLELFAYDICDPLFERLMLPSLTDISVCLLGNSPFRTPPFQLLRFFSRSKCKLDRLCFNHYDLGEAELFKCLEHDSCTSLVDFRIYMLSNGPILTDTILIALTDTPLARCNVLLPRLARLTLGMSVGGSPGRLGTMILSRRIPCHKKDQLQSFVIYNTIDEQDVILLELAKSQGLDVEYTRR